MKFQVAFIPMIWLYFLDLIDCNITMNGNVALKFLLSKNLSKYDRKSFKTTYFDKIPPHFFNAKQKISCKVQVHEATLTWVNEREGKRDIIMCNTI